jgi:hypothetical protein
MFPLRSKVYFSKKPRAAASVDPWFAGESRERRSDEGTGHITIKLTCLAVAVEWRGRGGRLVLQPMQESNGSLKAPGGQHCKTAVDGRH